MKQPELMNIKNVTRDFILLDLYRKDIIFYFSPSTVFLNAISASVLINLYLNNKVKLENGNIEIIDETSIRTYNKLMIDYLKENELKTLKDTAHEVFLDSDFSMELYELVIKELCEENLIEIETKKHLILNKTTIKLIDQNSVREAYKKLFDTLFNDEQSQEFIALALIIDTFFSVDDYFDESEHETIKTAIEELRKTELYQDIVVFKDVIEEFYRLTAQRSTNYFGI
ncbi:hypothetical protein OKW22_000842 [Bacilli bacterium PM5-3]|nr:hypothetical protein [Bacilli bacterium PM5-3]MDH6603488.1 hypothetical protein [Bacilli bacterium PM5-9]